MSTLWWNISSTNSKPRESWQKSDSRATRYKGWKWGFDPCKYLEQGLFVVDTGLVWHSDGDGEDDGDGDGYIGRVWWLTSGRACSVGQQSAVASAALNLTVEDPENLAVIEFGVMSVVKPVKEEVMLFIKGGVHKIGKFSWAQRNPFLMLTTLTWSILASVASIVVFWFIKT